MGTGPGRSLLQRQPESSELSLPHGRQRFRLQRLRRRPAVERVHERGVGRAEHRGPTRDRGLHLESVHGGHAVQLLRQRPGNYAVRHNPFVYYGDIANDATRCTRVVPAGSSDSALINDLGSTSTASNFMWLTPNTCNDMHDIHSCPIDTGDAYLADLVQRILSSPVFTTQRAALYITFDEGYGQPVYTVWAGRVVKPTYTSSVAYNHFSLLATIESNWNLAPLTSNDGGASPMTEFF